MNFKSKQRRRLWYVLYCRQTSTNKFLPVRQSLVRASQNLIELGEYLMLLDVGLGESDPSDQIR